MKYKEAQYTSINTYPKKFMLRHITNNGTFLIRKHGGRRKKYSIIHLLKEKLGQPESYI